MDQHPIPQDVTGFQFKLIGSMTVKQFGYVAVGVVSAVILYYLPLKIAGAILIKLVLIPILGASGVIIAFVPIDGRPIDIMTTNFMKALFAPNQYVYRKQGRMLNFFALEFAKIAVVAEVAGAPAKIPERQQVLNDKEKQLQAILAGSESRIKNKQDEREMAFLRTFSSMATASTPHAATRIVHTAQPATLSATANAAPLPAVTTPLTSMQAPQPVHPVPQTPTNKPAETPDNLSQQEATLAKELAAAKQEEAHPVTPAAAATAHQKAEELEKHIQEIHLQKQHLEQEIAHLKSQLTQQQTGTTPAAAAPKTVPTTSVIQPTPAAAKPVQTTQDSQHVRAIPDAMAKKVGLPHISDTPNVVVGIVKDSRGNVLPNMLVEIKDKDGSPVRAFKTNALGQFASATPLAMGTYTIELEDPKKQHKFDIIQIVANNQILMPIEIISHDAREELRQQLFA